MYRLSLYIARQLAAPYAFVLLALISLIIVIPSLRLIDVVLSKGLSPEAFVGLLIAYAPRDLAFALPFLVFLATASAYGRLSLDSELVALQATGRSNLQLMTPALVFGLLAGIAALVLETWLAPAGYQRYRDQIQEIRSSYANLLPQEGTFLSPVQGLTVFVREREPDGTLSGLLIHDGRDPGRSVSIVAREGRSQFSSGLPRFVVHEGSRHEMGPNRDQIHTLSFDRYVFEVAAGDRSSDKQRTRSVAERSLWELLDAPPDTTTSVRRQFEAEAQRRLQAPLFLLLMALAGVTPFLLKHRMREHPLRPLLSASVAAVTLEVLFIASPWAYASFPVLIPISYGALLTAIALTLAWAHVHDVRRRSLRVSKSGA